MDRILDNVICNGLGLPFKRDIMVNIIPQNVFGVFVSVKRSKSQKLSKWPEDTHGCIGYWDNNFNELDKTVIYRKLLEVSKSATHNDNRKTYFPKPLHLDHEASYEIYFMKTPLIPIERVTGRMKNGKMFSNDEYGLIVSNRNNRATYLPKVFKKQAWTRIKTDLLRKANLVNTDGIMFYAYKCKIVSKQIQGLINARYVKTIFDNYAGFINKNYRSFVPYSVKDGEITIDRSNFVRNMAVLNDLKTMGFKLNNRVFTNVERNIEYYIKMFYANHSKMRQASPFLLLALRNSKRHDKVKHDICRFLYENINKLEKKFELGEVLYGLTQECPNRIVLLKHQREMYNEILTENQDINNIFKYNWHGKFLDVLMKFLERNNVYVKQHIYEILVRALNIIDKLDTSSETNYLAVGLECILSLKPYINKTKLQERINQSVFKLFYLLQTRFKNGLYYFKNGDARIDITNHVLNGLILI